MTFDYKPQILAERYVRNTDSPYLMKAGVVYAVDISAGSVIMEMPGNVEPNDTVVIKHAPGTLTNGNTLTVNPNGADIEVPHASDTTILTSSSIVLWAQRSAYQWIYLDGTPGLWLCNESHTPARQVVMAQLTFSGQVVEGDSKQANWSARFKSPDEYVTGPVFPGDLTIVKAGTYIMAYTARITPATGGDFPQQAPGTTRPTYVRTYVLGTPSLAGPENPVRGLEAECDILYHVGLEGVSVPLGDEGIGDTNAIDGVANTLSGAALLYLPANQMIQFFTDFDYAGQTMDLEFAIYGII